jgi:chromosome segregation ATPase
LRGSPLASTTSLPSNHEIEAGGMTSVLKSKTRAEVDADLLAELDSLRAENGQLRSLCVELEQALQESSQFSNQDDSEMEARYRELESLVEQKSETIRQQHQEIQRSQSLVAELENQLANIVSARPTYSGPAPREDELMRLAEELERERRQLQEDEQTLMEQMREMEMGLARERAEIARQRNDLQRLQVDITHELDRLEKSGAVQNKIDLLKARLQDASTRRGMAPGSNNSQRAAQQSNDPAPEEKPAPSRGTGIFGRLFGGG